MSAFPAVYLGDFLSDGMGFLACIPSDAATGEQIRALHVLVRQALSPDTANYWSLRIGRFKGGIFTSMSSDVSLSGGIAAGTVKVVGFKDPLLVSRGDDLIVKVVKTGDAPPLSGLSLAVEYGVLSSNRSAR